jgi:sRNA-binding protein
VPDATGFNHLPHWGVVHHQCVECDWPGFGVTVSDADRARHHRRHANAARREQEKARKENLAKARKARKIALSEGREYEKHYA